MMHSRGLVTGLLVVCGLSLPCAAQCSTWETTIGNPGIAGGYAAAVRGWTGGPGMRIYIGGSFTNAGGLGSARYLAAWNPATGAWSPVGGGISGGFTNAFLTSIVPYNPGGGERLVVGGFFDTAGGVPQTASLAMWNGTSWQAMGTNWTGSTRGSIWSMAVWNGQLYVGGGVVNTDPTTGLGYPIGGQRWSGIASWDGQAWQSRNLSMTGYSPYVGGLHVFDDGSGEALYAMGRFDSIDGVPGTRLIAKFNGEAWSAVGGGLNPTSTLFGLEGATPFNDGTGNALVVAGYAFVPAGQPVTNVAKWNGASWTSLGGQIGTGRLTSIVAFDDGEGGGPALYIGGTAMPQINYFAKWHPSTQQWLTVDGGITGGAIPPSNFPSVFGLGVVEDRLYIAGNFVEVNGMPAMGLAARTSCSAACYANCDASTTEPILNVDDFTCFINEFAAAQSLPPAQQISSYANCDGSTVQPVLNVDDFTCFIIAFAQGCP
jgi:trimeric autotransporter adhesin